MADTVSFDFGRDAVAKDYGRQHFDVFRGDKIAAVDVGGSLRRSDQQLAAPGADTEQNGGMFTGGMDDANDVADQRVVHKDTAHRLSGRQHIFGGENAVDVERHHLASTF